MDTLMDWFGNFCLIFSVVALCIGLPVIGFACYASSQAPTFELRKDDWRCTEHHPERGLKGMTNEVCDEWSRVPLDSR